MDFAKYTKGIAAIVGVLIPTLNEWGVPLASFLTVDWVNGLLLSATPVFVIALANKDKQGNNVLKSSSAKSPHVVGVLALLLGTMMLYGCVGTREAYKAADGIEETATVMGEHYYATVRELNNLDDQVAFSPSALARAQEIVRTTRPLVLELASAAQAYEAVRSAENEVDLQLAINEAAKAISKLVDAVKAAGGDGAWLDEIESDIERVLHHQPLLAAP